MQIQVQWPDVCFKLKPKKIEVSLPLAQHFHRDALLQQRCLSISEVFHMS